ncbi:MAG TPA: Holliday junction resolvase RuvX [Gammaproteobacteria bacterium]|nr:Holliday junction resolvase RuvX [Gammaproteobacteria bacterium]
MENDAVYLAFDFGLKRIGVAVGQRLTGTASPLTTLSAQGGEPDWKAVARLVAEWRPAALVVGLPYNVDGSPQPFTGEARRFAERLAAHCALPVHLVDETLSSHAAAEGLRERRQAGGRRIRKHEIDQAAACVILETWLRASQ